MGRLILWIATAALAVGAAVPVAASAAVPPTGSGGGYTVRIGADSTGFSPGEQWENMSRSGGRLQAGSNGAGAFFVMGNTGVDPQQGDYEGWRLPVPAGVRLDRLSIDTTTGSWVGQRWTSGLRYTLSARDGQGEPLGEPFLQCQPTPDANTCPDEFRTGTDRTFTAPAGTRRVEFRVECVLAGGCSRTANPDGGLGGNEYAAVLGGTFRFTDDTAPVLTAGFGDLWTDSSRWFHNSDTSSAGMGATDNSGVSRIEWYVDGRLAFDTSGATSGTPLYCDYSRFKPCSDTTAQFPLDHSLFAIPDGPHELAVVAQDAAGNVSRSLTRQFRVDDAAPPAVAVTVREGSALRDPGPWHLDFTVPPALDGSPVDAAVYRFCAASNPDDCTSPDVVREGIAGKQPGAAASVAVSPPSEGEWTAELWLADQAGNQDEASASAPVLIRYGQSAPVADPAHPPTLSGDFTDGRTVRVSASGFQVAGAVRYAFQWQRCGASGCTDIPGASAQEYALGHSDAGRRVRAKVTASNAKGSDSAPSAMSPVVGLLPPSGGSAVLAGAMRAGEELSVVDVAFEGTPPFELRYAWLRCSSGACDAIEGAGGSSYVLTDDDVGQTIRSMVTASNSAGSATAEAARAGGAGGPVLPAPPQSVYAPGAPGGVAQVGRELTAADGEWSGSQPMTFTYVWQRCAGPAGGCAAIADARGRSYRLAAGDVGRTIRVLVTAANGGAPVGPVASERTSPVVAADEEEAPPPPEEPPGDVPPHPAVAPAAPPEPAAPAADLSKIPGNLVAASTCKVVRATPRKRTVKLRGAGRVTFSATVPSRVTDADPLRLTLKAGRSKVRSVTYRAGKRTVGRSRRSPFTAAVRPRKLQVGGTQTLTALVTARKGAKKPGRVAMRLNVAECPSLLTAGLRFSGTRAVTQLRVFSRTSIVGGTITVPAKLLPEKVAAGKRAGTLTLTGLEGRAPAVPLSGMRTSAAGISVRRSGRKVVFGGIPAGKGIVQIDLFGKRAPAFKLLNGRRPLRFSAKVGGQRLLAAIRPRGKR